MASDYSLEIGEYLYRLTCECCGTEKNRVWGFVSRNGDAHAVYYALLNVTEDEPRVGLTLSVGPWWEDTDPSNRSWVHLNVWSEDDGVHMNIRDPKESNFYPWPKGGKPLNREDAKASSIIQEIWDVADYVVDSDPAVSSYLNGSSPSAEGREVRNADGPVQTC